MHFSRTSQNQRELECIARSRWHQPHNPRALALRREVVATTKNLLTKIHDFSPIVLLAPYNGNTSRRLNSTIQQQTCQHLDDDSAMADVRVRKEPHAQSCAFE